MPGTDGTPEVSDVPARTTFSSLQLKALLTEYERDKTLSRKRCEELGKELGVEPRPGKRHPITAWFQNQRARRKAMPLEAMPLSTPESEAAIGNLGILEAGSKRRWPLGELTNDGTLSESHDLSVVEQAMPPSLVPSEPLPAAAEDLELKRARFHEKGSSGVTPRAGGRYEASIRINKIHVYLGSFDTAKVDPMLGHMD